MQALAQVHTELLRQCAHRPGDVFCHSTVHAEFHDVAFWKARGYCSVYCESSNWPHACDFTLCCNADREFCHCVTPCPLCRGPVTTRDAGVFVEDATCPVCLQTVSRITPLRPCGHALCENCAGAMY